MDDFINSMWFFIKKNVRSSLPKVFCRKGLETCNFIAKETLAQVSSCEYCEFFKNTYCYRTPFVAASVNWKICYKYSNVKQTICRCKWRKAKMYFLNNNWTQTLHKKWSVSLRISSVNVINSAVSCGFGHICWRNP